LVTDSSDARKSADEPTAWAENATRKIAYEIKRWRKRRGLSAQHLSDLTRDLGHRVPRTVIANLESGRRDSVSVPELLVIAAALNVPPVLFIAPVGHVNTVEILPQIKVSAWQTRGWILGAIGLECHTYSQEQYLEGRKAIDMYDMHTSLLREHVQLRASIRKRLDIQQSISGHEELSNEKALEYQKEQLGVLASELGRSESRIRDHRKFMSANLLDPPDLPPDLIELDATDRSFTPTTVHVLPPRATRRGF
jgi:transcriptional regulator with XRE-family HTH domain